ETFEAWRYDEPAFRGENARYDATDEEFVVEVDLARSTTLRATACAVTAPSAEVASASAAPGEAGTVPPGATHGGPLWSARADDGGGVRLGRAGRGRHGAARGHRRRPAVVRPRGRRRRHRRHLAAGRPVGGDRRAGPRARAGARAGAGAGGPSDGGVPPLQH